MSEAAIVPVTTSAPARVLPHSIEAEMRVLGGIFLHPSVFSNVVGLVQAADFYHPTHRAIYQAMIDLERQSEPIDEITVAQRMRQSDTFGKLRAFGDEAYFAQLSSEIVTVENIDWHAKLIADKSQLRIVIQAAAEIVGLGYSDRITGADLTERLEKFALNLSQRRGAGKIDHLSTALSFVLDDMLERRERRERGAAVGISSGFSGIDRAITAFERDDFIVIGARPSMGKTAWVCSMIRNICMPDLASDAVNGLMFSLEMKQALIAMRLLAADSGVNSIAMRSGAFTDEQYAKVSRAASHLSQARFWLCDRPALPLSEIRALARAWRLDPQRGGKSENGVVVLDYMQIVGGEKSDEEYSEQFVATISRGLKALARELGCPVVALSQLNRALESRDNKRPRLSDLRHSGAIEQDADVIGFLYRDAVYNTEADPNEAEFIIGKQRNGLAGSMVPMRWIPESTRFEDVK